MAYIVITERFKFDLTPVRLLYPHLDAPRVNKEFNNEPRYEADLLVPKDHPDWAACYAALNTVRKAVGIKLSHPVKDGDDIFAAMAEKGKDRPAYQGHYVIKTHATAEKPPGLVIIRNGTKVRLDPNDSQDLAQIRRQFYSGANVCAVIAFASYQGFGGGVSCYLNHLLALPGGKQLGGDPFADVEKYAKHLGGERRMENPAAGMDDEIPF